MEPKELSLKERLKIRLSLAFVRLLMRLGLIRGNSAYSPEHEGRKEN